MKTTLRSFKFESGAKVYIVRGLFSKNFKPVKLNSPIPCPISASLLSIFSLDKSFLSSSQPMVNNNMVNIIFL